MICYFYDFANLTFTKLRLQNNKKTGGKAGFDSILKGIIISCVYFFKIDRPIFVLTFIFQLSNQRME